MIGGPGVPQWPTGLVEVARGVYAYLQSKGSWGRSNAGLIVGDRWAIMVDTLFTVPLTEACLKEVRAVTDRPVRYLPITHHHGDHCWCCHLLGDSVVISSASCRREILQRGPPDPVRYASLFPEFDFTGVCWTLPDITFDNQLTLYQGNREVCLLHYGPAHTVGDALVYLPQEEVVFAGDLLFLYSTPLGVEGSFAGWIDVLKKMADLNAKTYVPGHGPPCGREGVLLCREYLELVCAEAKKGFDSGLPPRETAARIPLGRFSHWANPERALANVERLYREFRGEGPTSPMDVPALIAEMNRAAKAGWPAR